MAKPPKPFHNPFSNLKLESKAEKPAAVPKLPPKPPRAAAKSATPDIDTLESQLFLESVGAVERVRANQVAAKEPPSARDLKIPNDEAESLARLAELVSGEATFDLADSDEFVEGAVAGFDERVLRKLRTGTFAVGAHVDLHGLFREDAKEVLTKFITESKLKGHRCVLVVTGRGLHSKDSIPVLKEGVQSWLSRGKLARHVLAFCSARPVDGGAGAMYVLLRR
jgi:DNA-nicking Smr family endonuclease